MLLSFADVLDDPELLQAHRAPGLLRAVENICDDRGRRTKEGSLGGLSLMSQICKEQNPGLCLTASAHVCAKGAWQLDGNGPMVLSRRA